MEIVRFRKSEEFRQKADELFSQQKELLLKKFPFADIQHIGGTAVPGLLTKGDLDINVRVSASDFPKVVEEVKEMYEINQPENWSDIYASFKDDDSYNLPLGIQVNVIDSAQDFFLKTREQLLTNPKLVDELNKIKLSFDGEEMSGYRAAKAKFLEDLLFSL